MLSSTKPPSKAGGELPVVAVNDKCRRQCSICIHGIVLGTQHKQESFADDRQENSIKEPMCKHNLQEQAKNLPKALIFLYKLFESGFDIIFSGLNAGLLRGNIGKGKIGTGGDEDSTGGDAAESEFELLGGWWVGPKYHFSLEYTCI